MQCRDIIMQHQILQNATTKCKMQKVECNTTKCKMQNQTQANALPSCSVHCKVAQWRTMVAPPILDQKYNQIISINRHTTCETNQPKMSHFLIISLKYKRYCKNTLNDIIVEFVLTAVILEHAKPNIRQGATFSFVKRLNSRHRVVQHLKGETGSNILDQNVERQKVKECCW